MATKFKVKIKGHLAAFMYNLKWSGFLLFSPYLIRWIENEHFRQFLFFKLLRLRISPCILERIHHLRASIEERGHLFSIALFRMPIGGTCKTTGSNRTRLVDNKVLACCEQLDGGVVLEVGVSDGSSALRLIEQIPKGFTIQLSDRYPFFLKWGISGFCLISDSEGNSVGMEFGFLYIALHRVLRFQTDGWRSISTINPIVLERLEGSAIRFDATRDCLPEPAVVVKCSNLVHFAYFSEREVRDIVLNLFRSIRPSGFLILGHNNEKYKDGEAGLVIKKSSNGRMEIVECFNDYEIVHVVGQLAESYNCSVN